MQEFSVKLTPSNNKARTAFIALLMGAFVLFALSSIIPLYRGIVSLGGMICLVASLTLYTKYISPVYYYDFTDDGYGTRLFVVRQMNGKRQSTLCRISFGEIKKVERETPEIRKGHQTPTGYRKYSYLPTLSPDVCYRLTIVNSYEKAEILIEVTDELADVIKGYAREAREDADEE